MLITGRCSNCQGICGDVVVDLWKITWWRQNLSFSTVYQQTQEDLHPWKLEWKCISYLKWHVSLLESFFFLPMAYLFDWWTWKIPVSEQNGNAAQSPQTKVQSNASTKCFSQKMSQTTSEHTRHYSCLFHPKKTKHKQKSFSNAENAKRLRSHWRSLIPRSSVM